MSTTRAAVLGGVTMLVASSVWLAWYFRRGGSHG